jgi:hypothetical protein
VESKHAAAMIELRGEYRKALQNRDEPRMLELTKKLLAEGATPKQIRNIAKTANQTVPQRIFQHLDSDSALRLLLGMSQEELETWWRYAPLKARKEYIRPKQNE